MGGEKLLINKYMRKCQLIQLQVGFNTTLSPSVSVIAQRMFSNAKYTRITHSRQSLIKQKIKSQQQQQTWESKVIGKYIHKKKCQLLQLFTKQLYCQVSVFCGAK